MKRITLFIICTLMIAPLSYAYDISYWHRNVEYRSITVAAPAVGESKNGYFGVITHINVTIMNGSGNVYFAASPLTQIDMQGSAKLAVDVACALTGIDRSKYDFLFYVKSSSPIVGGPSAGATMTVATIALLENVSLNNSVAMTGMINPDGSVGPVGGILEKGEAVAKAGKKLFLIPKGQMVEYVTNYTREGWIVISRQIPVNVSEILYKKYGLIVKEVEDINQAFYYFTGYKFNESKSSKQITTADYRNIMKPLAKEIIEEANESYQQAKKMYENSKIPSYWGFNPKAQVGNRLDLSEEDLRDAKIAYENWFYYYGISKAFQSMINSRFVKYACMFYENDSIYDTLYNNVSKSINNAYLYVKNLKIDGLISLQCIGAAQSRVIEAINILNNSLNEWYSYIKYKNTIFKDDSKALDALYYLAYAKERGKTAYWWANLSENFNESYKINETWIENIAKKYYDYAKQIFAYSQTLVQETGSDKNYIENANNLLDKASNQLDNFPAASLFNSLESIANSNLAIEAIGGLTEDKVNRSSQMASYSILKARNESIEPILAVSYYEFGKSLYRVYEENRKSNDLINSAIYCKYAYMISNMLRLSKGLKINKPEYIGNINENNDNNSNKNEFYIYPYAFAFITLLVGIAIGYGIRRKRIQ